MRRHARLLLLIVLLALVGQQSVVAATLPCFHHLGASEAMSRGGESMRLDAMGHASMHHDSMAHESLHHESMHDESMAHESMAHVSMPHVSMPHVSMPHESMAHGAMAHAAMDHGAMDHSTMSHEPSASGADGCRCGPECASKSCVASGVFAIPVSTTAALRPVREMPYAPDVDAPPSVRATSLLRPPNAG